MAETPPQYFLESSDNNQALFNPVGVDAACRTDGQTDGRIFAPPCCPGPTRACNDNTAASSITAVNQQPCHTHLIPAVCEPSRTVSSRGWRFGGPPAPSGSLVAPPAAAHY